MQDFFRPHFEPSRTIYDAFCKESAKRKNLLPDVWQTNERLAVFNATVEWAKANNMIAPSLEDIKRAESNAVGSADYGAKWAYGVKDIIDRLNKK